MNSNVAKKLAQSSVEILWFVARGTNLKGPYTAEQLDEKIKKKEISHLDFCWRQGFREWRPISAVEDFDRRERLRELPSYPTVEVPCGGAELPVSREKARRSEREVHLSFAKSKPKSISAYEWAIAIVFGVALAFFASSMALNEVESGLEQKIGLMTLGVPQSFGEAHRPSVVEAWQPLYSAPGFTAIETGPVSPREGIRSGAMPVKISGHAVLGADGYYHIGEYRVVSSQKLPLWSSDSLKADSVYSKETIVQGYLSGKDAHTIYVKLPGEPLIFQ